jgi:ABC-2 type transport system permease protein
MSETITNKDSDKDRDLEEKKKASKKGEDADEKKAASSDDEEEESDEQEESEDSEDSEDEGDDDDDDDKGKRTSRKDDDAVLAAKPRSGVRVERGAGAIFFRNVLTIARRELGSYFNSALAYIVISLSLVGFGVHFFLYQGGVWQIERASMARLFQFAPGVLCFLTIPLFTMRALSEEKRLGTMELLITLPVRDSEVILGKFIGAYGMLFFQIILLGIYPIVMFVWPWHLGVLDWGPFWSAMLGMLLMSSAGVGIGLMMSGFTESQILSFFLTAVGLAVLYYVGEVVQYLPGWPGDVISFFSFQSRVEPFTRGVIDSRAVVYFVSVTVLSLLVSFRTLESRKWA